MSYCLSCSSGASGNPKWPCQDTCAQHLEDACTPYSANLNREWNLYVNDVAKLANRLKTSFNIELAVKPINIQISEAIMTFQENAVAITNRVGLLSLNASDESMFNVYFTFQIFSKCGKPPVKKVKRNTYMYNQRLPAKPTYTTSTPLNGLPLMETLISDILKTLKRYKNFWSRLPRNLCSQYSNLQTNCNNHTQRCVRDQPVLKLKQIASFKKKSLWLYNLIDYMNLSCLTSTCAIAVAFTGHFN